jgi:hypothetical protein
MSFSRMTGRLVFGFYVTGLGPACAAPQDCADIAAAFAKMGQAPTFQQTILQDGLNLQATAIGDTLYMAMDGEVSVLPLDDGGRAQMFASFFDTLTVTDCSALPDEDLDGKPMRVFDYVLPANPPFVPAATAQRLWVGVADELPYRATNPTGEISIRYEDVKAPPS